MSRIQPLKIEELSELKGLFEKGKELMGFTPNDGLTMAHRPDILKAFFGLVQAIYTPGEVADGLKRMIGMIASSAAGCQYCESHAAHSAFKNKETSEKIKAVWEFQTSPLFTTAERVALSIAMKSATTPNEVSDEDFNELKQHYSTPQIIEIISVIAMYGFLNRWNATLKTELESTPLNFIKSLKKTS